MTGASRRVVLLVFLGSLLLQLAWVFAVPPYRGMDEFDHVYRADSVAAGYVLARPHRPGYQGRGDLVRARASSVGAAYPICHSYSYVAETDCRPAGTFHDGTVLVASGAARYNPAYYWVIGTAARWLDGAPALYLMRIVDAFLCSFLIGLAAWATTLWSTSAWPVLGVTLVCTPVAMYSGSTPAPNGPEMFAGVALWCCLLGLRALHSGHPQVRSLLRAAVVPALVLTEVRTLGPLWLALVVLSALAVIGMTRARQVLDAHRGLVTVASTVVVIATGVALWWSRSMGANSLANETDQHNAHALANSLRMIPVWFAQSIAAFPDKFDPAPNLVYVAAIPAMGAILVMAIWRGTRWLRVTLALVFLTAMAVPFFITWRTWEQIGPVWQGRYAWPYACGSVLLSTFVLDYMRLHLSRFVLVAIAGSGSVLVHLPGPLAVLHHESRTSPLAGSSSWWLPSPWVVGVLATAGLAAWLASLLAAQGRQSSTETPGLAPTPRGFPRHRRADERGCDLVDAEPDPSMYRYREGVPVP